VPSPSATAVLGQRASLSQVAGLAGLELDRASQAADALAATRLLRPGLPLSFEHPLIASAVLTSMAPLARGTAHRRAARILSDEGASAEQIASHLLAALPQSDPDSVEVLRTAARNALLNGAPDTAVRMLERALAEEPAPETYADVLAELGQAELSAGLPRAAERLEDARRRTALTPRRAELALVQAKALYDQERYRDAAEVADNALAELGPKDAAPVRELEAAYIAAASLVPDLLEHSRRRGAEMLAGIKRRPSADERDTIAHMAIRGGLYGEDRVYVRRLVDLGWSDGALLESDTSDKASWPLLSGASLFVDELERDLELCDAGLARARKHGSPVAYATASYCRTWALYERGFIVDALADARAALDASPNAWRSYVRPAYGAIASCHVVRGELEQAEAALSSVEHQLDKGGIQPPFLLNVRAKLRLAQNQPAAALGDAVESGRRLEDSFGFVSPGVIPWRSTAALAYIALAEPERACELAGEELDQARRIGVHRLVVRNLRILGLATRRIDLLTEAVREGGARPPRLEYTLALVDLGAALRRSNHRAAAREPLRKGLELSHRGGATAVADHARTELAATGARPRREMLSGVESLTPSERRIADLATKGFTTRQMAKSLFVTPKTVEFHLRNTYQKLGVRSRTQLVSVLDGDGSPAVTENL
jgi:ATP/maltotriose-dependent transcriptional regulator MalT